jgi:hexosaminidase
MPLSLIPMPSSVQVQSAKFEIPSELTIALEKTDSHRLRDAVQRFQERLRDKTGRPLASSFVSGSVGTIVLDVASDGEAVQGPDENESYKLSITDSSVLIEAPTTVGAMHALETLFQLAHAVDGKYVIQMVQIEDSPRFAWRGLMIDCGRHFEPIPVLKRNIDAMAAVKLNVFHWHLTEDQGFRIESKAFPLLTGKGSDGLFYTQEQARDLVRYARDRGIRVVPEFEMPGHSTAWLYAYPELASGTTPTGIRREFGVSDTAIDPTREETYRFIKKFLSEMTTIFPDEYVHIGGDETPAPDWKKNPRILAFMHAHNLRDNAELQAYFNQHVLAILTSLHRHMMGWDEILTPGLPHDVVVQSWRGEASLAAGARGGYSGVLSAPYYLDAMKPAEVHYLADPIPADTQLTPAQQKLILGGEVTMWGEHLNERTIDSRIWPRTAAIAERFWSPQNVRDVSDMYRRLEAISVELESFGTRHLTSDDAGLRGLVDSENISALRVFAAAFEPVPFHERAQQQHTSQSTPLTSFVDAVRPDPPIRFQLEHATQIFLAHPRASDPRTTAAKDRLQNFFFAVAGSIPDVEGEVESAPRLQSIKTRMEQLRTLTTIAQQALGYLSTGSQAPAAWKQQSLENIEVAEKPSAMIRFLFLPDLARLVNAVQ